MVRANTVAVPIPHGQVRALVRALRPYQWVKNALVAVPLITSHQLFSLDLWTHMAGMFLCFCLCASSIYVANDLLDIPADRLHPRKRHRPFAAGELSVATGIVLSIGLFVSALALAFAVSSVAAAEVLAVYALVSTAYSLRLKREPVLDVFVLAALYVLRVFAGGVATGIVISAWLLAFAMFFFLHLALVKRYTELVVVHTVAGRGYTAADASWMHVAGISAGCMATVVLALYTTAPEVVVLYRAPTMLMWLCPVLLYSVLRTWFRATRNLLQDDPILEVVRDPSSYLVLAIGAAILYGAV
jgi:4-hydroxybenzoate polyprenyltransferase